MSDLVTIRNFVNEALDSLGTHSPRVKLAALCISLGLPIEKILQHSNCTPRHLRRICKKLGVAKSIPHTARKLSPPRGKNVPAKVCRNVPDAQNVPDWDAQNVPEVSRTFKVSPTPSSKKDSLLVGLRQQNPESESGKAGWISWLAKTEGCHKGKAAGVIQKLTDEYGWPRVQESLREMQGRLNEHDAIEFPCAYLRKVVANKRDPEPQKPEVPFGAIDLGDGQWVSPWGSSE